MDNVAKERGRARAVEDEIDSEGNTALAVAFKGVSELLLDILSELRAANEARDI